LTGSYLLLVIGSGYIYYITRSGLGIPYLPR